MPITELTAYNCVIQTLEANLEVLKGNPDKCIIMRKTTVENETELAWEVLVPDASPTGFLTKINVSHYRNYAQGE